MIAWLQRVTTLSLLTAVAVWALAFARQGEYFLAGAGALLLLFGYALFLAFEFVALALTSRDNSVPRASPGQLLAAWLGEVLAAPQVFCWRQPFRTHAEPDHLAEHHTGRRGVLLVHGFLCNRALWNPWMRRLRALGVPYLAVSLEPAFGSIDAYIDTIDAAARRIESATGQPPVVVAHSMGGLATRAWLAGRDAYGRVHRIVTIGTPHHGTWLARFGHTPNTRQMRLGSAWLSQLARREPPGAHAAFTSIYSHCDNIVFPVATSRLAGADNRHVAAYAHVELAFAPEVFDEVMRWLRSGDEAEAARRRTPPQAVPTPADAAAPAANDG